MKVNVFVEQVKTHGITLHAHQFNKSSCAVNGKPQFIWMLIIKALPYRKEHARACVNHKLAAEVGLLFVAFDEQFLGSSIQFPVDVSDRLTSIIESMFGKLDRKAMKRTLVQAGDEAFDNLFGEKLEIPQINYVIPLNWQNKSC